jgi:hypothetical protein
MLTAYSSSAAYVDPFARAWPGFATTDPDRFFFIIPPVSLYFK